MPLDFGVSARLTDSEFFVVEADEYDTAFFDKRSKFVHYRPRTAVLNNLDFDHADIFPDLAAIETQFHHLMRTVPGNGRIIANGDEPSLARVLARGLWSELERFGAADARPSTLRPCQWTVADDGAVALNGERKGMLDLASAGRHNRMNALAALLAARHAGVPIEAGIDALASFRGVRRRMELLGIVAGVAVYDDFAHHPTAIAATIAGLRASRPQGRILAVLEPRSNTMKQGTMKAALPGALAQADRVYCYTAGLDWDARAALAPLGANVEIHDGLSALIRAVSAGAQPGDHVLVMSNGGFGGVHAKILDALAE